MSVRHKGCNRL